MKHQTKIATCSYCGNRQMLRLTARDGHELACGSCGAPLHEMKWLKSDRDADAVKRSPRRPAPHGMGLPHQGKDYNKLRKRKKRRSLLGEVFEEAFDLIEDIFD